MGIEEEDLPDPRVTPDLEADPTETQEEDLDQDQTEETEEEVSLAREEMAETTEEDLPVALLLRREL